MRPSWPHEGESHAMFTAMDSACKARLRWIVVVVGLCASAGVSGCARLQEYRHHDVPMLGTVGKENKYPKLAETHSRPSKDDGESADGSLARQIGRASCREREGSEG